MYNYMHIYIYGERERCTYIYIYMYIHIYIYISYGNRPYDMSLSHGFRGSACVQCVCFSCDYRCFVSHLISSFCFAQMLFSLSREGYNPPAKISADGFRYEACGYLYSNMASSYMTWLEQSDQMMRLRSNGRGKLLRSYAKEVFG